MRGERRRQAQRDILRRRWAKLAQEKGNEILQTCKNASQLTAHCSGGTLNANNDTIGAVHTILRKDVFHILSRVGPTRILTRPTPDRMVEFTIYTQPFAAVVEQRRRQQTQRDILWRTLAIVVRTKGKHRLQTERNVRGRVRSCRRVKRAVLVIFART